MLIREAVIADIPQMQVVRHAVKENTLSDPALVSNEDYIPFLTQRGKGWVCEVDHRIAGFAIVDLQDHNVWALFVHPDADRRGIGRQLHNHMLDWYFALTNTTLWLGTAPHTRAETFYRMSGWTEVGMHGKDEIKFEMSHAGWMARQ